MNATTMTTLPPEAHTHIFSYLQPGEVDELRETCTKICDAICDKRLVLSRCHPVIEKFTPEIKNPTRLQSWQCLSRLTRLVSTAEQIGGPYWVRLLFQPGWEISQLQFENMPHVRRPCRWVLEEGLQIPFELLLMTASFFPDPTLQAVPINYEYLSTQMFDIMIILHLASLQKMPSHDPQLEKTVEKKLFDLIHRSSLFSSDLVYPSYHLSATRNQLMSLALLFAAEKGFKDIYSKLLQLETPSAPNEKRLLLACGDALIYSLCANKITTRYIRELLCSEIEISRLGLWNSLRIAADHNNHDALQEIFRAKPGALLDQSTLKEIRDSFRLDFNPVFWLFWEQSVQTRQANFPNEESRSAMIDLFNNEIAERYPPSPAREPAPIEDEEIFHGVPLVDADVPQEALLVDVADQAPHQMIRHRALARYIPGEPLFDENGVQVFPRQGRIVLQEEAAFNPFQEEEPQMAPNEVRGSSRLFNNCCSRCTIS